MNEISTKGFKKSMLLILFCSALLYKGVHATPIDTIYAGNILTKASLIKSSRSQYMMIVKSGNSYKSIKLLDRSISITGDRMVVVQKLIETNNTNTDSVIVNRQSLLPLESYSNINTGKDRFLYRDNRVYGSVTPVVNGKIENAVLTDTTFRRTMFNGLIYAETFQAMDYKKNRIFYIAEYVPGHQTKYSKIEYIKDETLIFSGKRILTKILKVESSKRDIYYWLNDSNQELIKIEFNSPNFEYSLLKII